MKTNLIFLIFCLWTFDSAAGPKPKHRNPPQHTVNQPPQEPSTELEETWESVEPRPKEAIPACPPNSLSTSPRPKDHSNDSLGSRQSAHSSPLEPEPLQYAKNQSGTTTPEWVDAKTESAAEATPLSDFIKSWQMWFKETVQDPKLQDRLKRFFNLTKTYEIFSEELAGSPEERKQETFDNLIKIFNTEESPLFGYELLSEAITQAIHDRQEAKLHQLTKCAIPHKQHLPPAILESAINFLRKRNEAEASTIAAELAATLSMIYQRADTIKKIEQPISPLPPLTESMAQDIANEETFKAIQIATHGFVQPKKLDHK